MTRADEASATFALDDGGPSPDVLRFSHAAMATVFEVHCTHPDAAYAAQAAQAAFDLLDRLEGEQSRFVANSDVSRINALARGEGTRVSASTMECLGIAGHLHDLTAGAFDASIGTGWEALELAPDEFTVRARAGGARLDLGGIGKGYAVDRMAELLAEWEIARALVHGGFSSVRALEPPPGRDGWTLRLRAPQTSRILARVTGHRRAFGASGTRKGEHILDPRTGQPVEGRAAAWVAVAAREEAGDDRRPAAVADALSTAFMVLPTAEIAALCGRFPELEAWLVPEASGRGTAPAPVHLGGTRPGRG